ncbi:SPOC domain-containing protein 1 isoform X2 [Dendrobates tinctorius]|uniref:SPOC domain-containing protein 1 isoform X2 n=1 Tax=Dendrobates tinctorius TaxID=92724 RepID=UPI003CCA17C2
MAKRRSVNASELDDRDCHSPLGLFEKFMVEIPPDPASFPDPDVPRVSESPSAWESKHSMVTPNFEDVSASTRDKSGLLERMRLVMNTGSGARNRAEDESCILVGSWNVNSKEVEMLDELEKPSDQTELDLEITVQDVSDNDDVVICEEDTHVTQKKVKNLLYYPRSTENLPESVPPTNSKVKLGKRKSKKKTFDIENPHDSLILFSAKSPLTVRGSTVQTLYEVLMRRVKETKNLELPEETLKKLAENVEEEIFGLYHDTSVRYKTKYRSLLFNLKDPRNKGFFQSVVLGEITPQRLVLMSPAEMARQELTDWRNQERQHTLEMIQKAETELNQKQQMIKLTHKGLIEIDTSPDQMFSLEDLSDAPWKSKDSLSSDINNISEITVDTTAHHKTHLLDSNCLICMGKIKPSDINNMGHWAKTKSPITNVKEKSYGQKLQSSEAAETIDCMENDVLGSKSENASSSESAIWKGLIEMFSIKAFKVRAMQVSGYSAHLCQKLPKMITTKGVICQESVWEYVDLIWPASTKDMCLLRFCPQTSSDAVFYSRVYSYLSRKLRYGIINTSNMEAFIIPLPACQPIPAKLRPLGGSGLEDEHPDILLALLLPNHPFWSSCPRKVTKIPREEELDIPDDIFTSILEDVEREENLMAEQGHSPVGQESSGVGEVGMPELINILSYLSNNLQTIADQNNNNFQSMPPINQPNPIPAAAPVWPSCPMAPTFQAPVSFGNDPAAMFDPSTMYGPSGSNPYTF